MFCASLTLAFQSGSGAGDPDGGRLTQERASPSGGIDRDDVAAVIEGKIITLSEVDALILDELRPLLDRIDKLRQSALERIILNHLFVREAQRRGITVEALYQDITGGTEGAGSPAPPPRLAGALPLDALELLSRRQASLAVGARTERLRRAVAEWKKGSEISVYLRPDPLLVADVAVGDNAFLGEANAEVTVIEFLDYQCPHCRLMAGPLHEILEEYGGKIRYVPRDFPVNDNPLSIRAARAAECAREQGRFWEYHDALLRRETLRDQAFAEIAAALELDGVAFSGCLESDRYLSSVLRDKEDGKLAGVEGTPTFFVNGRMVAGALSAAEFKTVIEQALLLGGKSR